jgi:hypothetical protein
LLSAGGFIRTRGAVSSGIKARPIEIDEPIARR